MHFTYNEKPNIESLCQGDLLTITKEIKIVLNECHPYFLKSDYKYFMVLTQSCDLVRRKGSNCKSNYITLAAVRSYDDFINRKSVLFKIKEINGLKLLIEPRYNEFKQLIERIYNNTESEHFFLAQEAGLNLFENMVAYLKVSFALKSELHYDKCLNAKVLELSDEFKAKLGWLTGDMYSRVGTRDWMSVKERKDFMEMIDEDINKRFYVISKEKLKVLEKEIRIKEIDFEGIDGVQGYLDSLEIKSNYDEIMDIIDEIVRKQNNLGNDEEKIKLIGKIRSNQQIRYLVR